MSNNSEYKRQYHIKNKERLRAKSKKWREDNPEKYAAQMAKYRATEKNKAWRKKYMASYNKEHYQKDAEYHRERARKYRKLNPDKVRAAQRNWTRNKIANDENFRLTSLFRRRIYSAIKYGNALKAYKTMELVGCSVEELKEHIEKQFEDWMTWENYGRYTWHIDHIIPCSSFDLTKPEEQKKCFHYTNLQPLYWRDNIEKSNRIMV